MTNIEQSYKKLFAAQNAVERWQDELKDDLRQVGERYMELKRKLGHCPSWDRFPAGIETITDHGKVIHVFGYWTRRGCTDAEYCDIPKELVYASPEDREKYFAAMLAEIDAEEQVEEQKEEARERAIYEALRTKFEGDKK